ncbi:MAG: oxidoreductase [Lachnospiraceae bacterium]
MALITGASSGIGLETALLFLNEGFKVYACARRLEQMETIRQKGGELVSLDLTSEESMEQCVHFVLEKEGHIDILVNNAGYGSCGSIEDIPMEEIRHQYEVNVFGLGRMIQLVLPSMRKQKSGKIINISSMGGRFTSPYGGWYHSTKYAVESISDALRMEVKPWNIDVIIIEPGMIQTNWGVIAAENIRKFSSHSAYKKQAQNAALYYEKRYKNVHDKLSDPKEIAHTIRKAALSPHPKTRYLTGKYSFLFIFLRKILSDKLFQSVCCTSMGLQS